MSPQRKPSGHWQAGCGVSLRTPVDVAMVVEQRVGELAREGGQQRGIGAVDANAVRAGESLAAEGSSDGDMPLQQSRVPPVIIMTTQRG